jgi:hypothetical protein
MPSPIEHMMSTVERATLLDHPYVHFHAPELMPSEDARELTNWLRERATWWEQKRDFYTHDSCDNLDDCPLVEGDGVLSQRARAALARTLSLRLGIDLDPKHVSLCAHRMQPGHGIGVHTDDPKLGTEAVRLLVTLQHADYEDRNGGHFCLFTDADPKNVASIYRPLHNLGIGFVMSDRSYHAVNDVIHGDRYSLVFGFWDRTQMPRGATPAQRRQARASLADLGGLPGAEPLLQLLRDRGAHRVQHSGATLLSHLLGVAAILLEWECDADVCRAGLFHSVYGTATFRNALFYERERDLLRRALGEPAERLVWLFSVVRFSEVYRQASEDYYLARRRDAEEPLALSVEDISALNIMAFANMIEQAPASPMDPGDVFEWRQVLEKLEHFLPRKAVNALNEMMGGAVA